jgi:hypothetical protein
LTAVFALYSTTDALFIPGRGAIIETGGYRLGYITAHVIADGRYPDRIVTTLDHVALAKDFAEGISVAFMSLLEIIHGSRRIGSHISYNSFASTSLPAPLFAIEQCFIQRLQGI